MKQETLVSKLKSLAENCENKSKNVYAYFYPNEVRNMIRAERKIKFKVGETKHTSSERVQNQTKVTAVSEDCVEAWSKNLSRSSVKTDRQIHLMMEYMKSAVRVTRSKKNSTEWFETSIPQSIVDFAYDTDNKPDDLARHVSGYISELLERVIEHIETLTQAREVESISVPVYMNRYAVEMMFMRDWYNENVLIRDLSYLDGTKANQPYIMTFDVALKMIERAELCPYVQPTVLVIEAIEFVDILLELGYNPSKVTFATTSQQKGTEVAERLVNVINSDSLLNNSGITTMMKFDVCLQNPPFSKDLKFVNLACKISNRVVAIHPCHAILNRKENRKTNDATEYCELVSENECSWEYVGFDCFSADISAPVGITYINKLKKSKSIQVSAISGKFIANGIDVVNPYGEWITPFFNLISEDSLESRVYKNSRANDVEFSGNHYVCSVWKRWKNAEVYSERQTNNGWVSWAFDTEEEAKNFLAYTKTKFANIMLSLYKVNGNIHNGELAAVPWLDFTQEWTDDKLFAHFDISDDVIDSIPADFSPIVR